MAKYTTSVVRSNFRVNYLGEVDTECSTTHSFEIIADNGDLINIALIGNSKVERYISNGVSYSFNDFAEDIIFDTTLTLIFSITNSGSSGVFNSVEVLISSESAVGKDYNETFTRFNDEEACHDGPIDGTGDGTYDGLTDTPDSKIGHAGKIVMVSEDETMHIYADMPTQLTPEELEALLGLTYVDFVSTLTVVPSDGERGLSTPLQVSYRIESNSDTITSATISQGIGSVLTDVDQGIKTVSGGSTVLSKTFSLSLNYDRKGTAGTNTKNATYTAHIPQWAGWSSSTDLSNLYSGLQSEANFQKYAQSSASLQKSMSPIDQYIWFVSNKSTAKVYDTNDFLQIQAAWGDPRAEFWTKPLTLTLADGVTSATVYLYRSRQTKSLSSFTYKIA